MFISNKPLFQFKLFRIPVVFGISALFNFVFVIWHIMRPFGLLAALLSITLIITVHELGHAFMARRLGYRVNVIAVQFAGGYCQHEACQYERDDVLIAWGGVLGQAALVAVVVPLYFLLYESVVVHSPLLQVFFGLFIYHNIFMIIYNLLPLRGFDGELAWRFVARRLRRDKADPSSSTQHRGERRVNKIIKFKKPKRPRRDGDISAEAREFADQIMEDIMKKQRNRQDKDKKE